MLMPIYIRTKLYRISIIKEAIMINPNQKIPKNVKTLSGKRRMSIEFSSKSQ